MTDFERVINQHLMEACAHEQTALTMLVETEEDCLEYNAEVEKAREALSKVEEMLDTVADGDDGYWLEDVLSADLINLREMAWDAYSYLYKQCNDLLGEEKK